MAMAAGLKRTVLDREFRRLVVARPTVSMGRELGFLPGSLEEKLNPWMQPIHDALELLSDLNMGSDHRRSTDLMRSGADCGGGAELYPGPQHRASIHGDRRGAEPDAAGGQDDYNAGGERTKIIFTGDPYQIDNPYVDSSSNGFNYIISKFATSRLQRISSCKRASGPSWRSWRRIYCRRDARGRGKAPWQTWAAQ